MRPFTWQPSRESPKDGPESRTDQNNRTSVTPKPKKKILPIILSIVSLAIMMSVFKECQREQLAQQQTQQANTTVTVWIPRVDGRLIPYWEVEILDRGSDYVRFRTQGGEIIEQHGSFRIEVSKRSDH